MTSTICKRRQFNFANEAEGNLKHYQALGPKVLSFKFEVFEIFEAKCDKGRLCYLAKNRAKFPGSH